jgi:hypothetical protein
VASSIPYVQAIAGLIRGSTATAEEIDAVLTRINAEADVFLSPLPPDDGSTRRVVGSARRPAQACLPPGGKKA